MRSVSLVTLPVIPYGQALAMQHAVREALWDEGSEAIGTLMCLEHPPTVTLGKRGKDTDLIAPDLLRANGVEVFSIDRGGEATFHAPGQLILYPVMHLERLNMGVVDVIRGLARCVIEVLSEHGIPARYDDDHPGVWVDDGVSAARKIASVGMRVRNGVCTHGVAVNVTNEMSGFSLIVPCGIPDAPMTRLLDEVDETPVSVRAVRAALLPKIMKLMDVELIEQELELPGEAYWAKSLPI